MGQKEGDLNAAIMMGATKLGHRLFRNQRGKYQKPDGSWISYGIGPNGASDLLGFARVTITPEMVGETVAVFLVVEAKTGLQKPRGDQERFLAAVRRLGGIALWGRDAETVLSQLPRKSAT